MGISLYYSRADFDCPYYWEEGYRWKDGTVRVPSYDPDEKPETWKKFQEFVYAQLEELVTGYGRIDSLWYDGGCDGIKLGLPEMTEKLREYQPWMLGVLRNGGVCEDIVTPELVFPEESRKTIEEMKLSVSDWMTVVQEAMELIMEANAT